MPSLRLSVLAILSGSILLSSCASNEALEDRLETRNANYENLQERRGMRQQARDERDDAWYDRVMH